MNINPELVHLAQWRLDQMTVKEAGTTKQAFIPPGAGGDPSQGGGAPADPNGQPVDPSQGGGAPPAPPPMASGPGGAAPAPGGGGMTPDTITQVVQQVMQQQGAMGGGAAGGAGAAGKMAKPDINTVAIDIFQVKKMLQYLFTTMGIPMPPDILDGPNRDPSTGAPMQPGAPGSTSDPTTTAQNAQQQPQPGGGAAGGAGGQGPIQPIQPMEGGNGAGATKAGEDRSFYLGRGHNTNPASFDPTIISKASALAALYRRVQQGD